MPHLFPSLDHEILHAFLCKYIEDDQLRQLIKTMFVNVQGGNDVTQLVIMELQKNAAPAIKTGTTATPTKPIMQNN